MNTNTAIMKNIVVSGMKNNKRYLQILKDLSNGFGPIRSSKRLKISPRTVEAYILAMRKITKTRNDNHLVAFAFRNKIIK